MLEFANNDFIKSQNDAMRGRWITHLTFADFSIMHQTELDAIMADGRALFIHGGALPEDWSLSESYAQRMAPGAFVQAQGCDTLSYPVLVVVIDVFFTEFRDSQRTTLVASSLKALVNQDERDHTRTLSAPHLRLQTLPIPLLCYE